MANDEIQLYLALSIQGAEAEEIDELTTHMLRELPRNDFGVQSVKRLASDKDIPEGAKPGDPVTWGALALVAVPVMLPSLIQFLQAWLVGGQDRKVRIKNPAGFEIEFTPDKALSEAEMLALADNMAQLGDTQASTGAAGSTQK